MAVVTGDASLLFICCDQVVTGVIDQLTSCSTSSMEYLPEADSAGYYPNEVGMPKFSPEPKFEPQPKFEPEPKFEPNFWKENIYFSEILLYILYTNLL
jgi:hypothetical protein